MASTASRLTYGAIAMSAMEKLAPTSQGEFRNARSIF
jgi:hypothetical protein